MKIIDNQRIVIIHPFFSAKNIDGNFFYLEEIAQYIFDTINKNIFILNNSSINRKDLYERYNFIINETKEINNKDIIICSMHSIPFVLENINKIDKIFIVESANTVNINTYFKQSILFNMFKYRNKFYLLSQKEFSKINTSLFFENRIINIIRGFYFKYYKISNKQSNEWLLYNNITDTDIQDNSTINITKEYCVKNNITYINSSDIVNLNPANYYYGLLYVRKKDFMPRIPYEFWFYNKPVIFFDISSGLLIKYDKKELPLYTEIVKNNFMKVDLSNLMELIC